MWGAVLLLCVWGWTALLGGGASAQTLDSTAPVLLSVAAVSRSADVRTLSRWLECSAHSCGAGTRCADRRCDSTAEIVLKVQDLPLSDDLTGTQPAGIKRVSVRFASPTAQRLDIEADYTLDENIDRTKFSIAKLDFEKSMNIGSGSGIELRMPVDFDGYAESGDWRLDSVVLEDHNKNSVVLNRDSLRGITGDGIFSITVSSLELSVCSGSCNGADVTCRQFGAQDAVSSRTPRHRTWWRCTSERASPEHQVCN